MYLMNFQNTPMTKSMKTDIIILFVSKYFCPSRNGVASNIISANKIGNPGVATNASNAYLDLLE
jgi:hypothetical protein